MRMSKYIDADELHSQGWVAARYINWAPTPLNDNFRLEVEVKPFITFDAADVERVRYGRWIWKGEEGDSRFMCSVCHSKEYVPTCNGKPTVWFCCPNCGAIMVNEDD